MLFGSKILEIAAGIFFVFMVMSMLASSLNEWIAALVSLRAHTLRGGITHLLADPVITGLAERFYQHPLIEKLGAKSGREPSYISARTFSTVLLDLLPIHDETKGAQTPLETFQRLRASLADLNSQDSHLGRVLLNLIDRVGVSPEQIETAQALLTQLNATRIALAKASADPAASSGGEVATSLFKRLQDLDIAYKSLEAGVSSSMEQAQKNIEVYFDQAMERLTGQYRRHTQLILLLVSLFLTVLFNVDTFEIVNGLWTNDALRATVVKISEAEVLGASSTSPSAITNTVGITATPAISVTQAPTATFEEALTTLESLNLPIGWKQDDLPERMEEWLLKILGLLVTTAVVAMGAPFWYDLLAYVTNVRLAGRPPKSSVPTSPPAEPS
jgi:hypothetical protein